MGKLLFMMRWGRACLGTLLLTLATLCASAASPKRVLILNPFGRDVAPFSAAASVFRTTLARQLGEPVDFYAVANAPLFGSFASGFGLGPIGGRLFQHFEIGAQGARTAIRILRGERPGSIPPQVFEAAAPVFDGRELQRWGVSEARLAAGSVIQFRQPAFWERYRWPIAGTVLFCLLQAALILALLMNRAKRRQGEAEATLIADISSKFVNLPSSEVDREIMEAERRICEFLGLDISALWQLSDEAPDFFTVTHFYSVQEGPQPPRRVKQEDFPWFRQQMLAGRIVAISSLAELPAEADHDRESCRQLGVKSNLCLPLSVGGKPPFGILGLNTTQAERDWPDALVKRLQLVAQIFTNALARKRADQTLRESEEAFRMSEARLAAGADLAGLGYYEVDFGERACFVDVRFHDICGVPAGHQPSLQPLELWMEHLYPDNRQRVLAERQKMQDGRLDRLSIEYRYLHPAQGQKWTNCAPSSPTFARTTSAPGK